MNLSHNDIGVTGAQHIGRALCKCIVFECINISDNKQLIRH
jgi:hypothetical protein